MAVGEFDVIGILFPDLIILPPESTYANASKSFSHTNLDALEIIDSWIPHNGPGGWNWAPYDNWKYDSGTQNFVFNPGNADGYIDMVFMISRNATYFNPNDSTDFPGKWFGGGWGAFDGAAALGNIAINFVTNDGYTVHAPGSPTNISALSSGITFRTGGPRGKWETFGLMAHEYGHYLFGGGHTNYTGIMGGGTYAMNGWERIKVNQIVPMVASGDGNQYYLGDFITTGNILKIPIPITQPNSTTYFLIENHQRTSSYDHIIRGETVEGGYDYTGLGKGLFVSRIKYGETYTEASDKFEIFTADGYYSWEYVGDFWAGEGFYVGRPWQGWVPKTNRIAVNRQSGKNDRMPAHWYWNNHWANKWCDKDIYGNYWLSRDVMGDFTDAFTLSYNNLLTRWSNPSTYVGGNTDISIQLVSENAGICTVKVFSTYNSGLSLPPSKPQFLKVQAGQNNRPYLTWDENLEDDILRYDVWKKKFINGSWQWSFLTSTTNNFYLDATEVFCGPPPAQCENQAYVYYKILAVDTDYQQSVFSDPVVAAVQGSPPDKISVDLPSSEKPTEYSLMQNFPNPFNPVTTISYSIPSNGLVTLKVYDILGTELAELVNEAKEAGNYSVTFNASNLPSGIYFYTLTSGNYTATKKLILLK